LVFALIVGILQIIRGVPLATKKYDNTSAKKKNDKLFYNMGMLLSIFLISAWIIILAYTTSIQHPILRVGIPLILVGIITIILEIGYVATTAMRFRWIPPSPPSRPGYPSPPSPTNTYDRLGLRSMSNKVKF
jgi:O-antigen/teichoic acid export membrane protein